MFDDLKSRREFLQFFGRSATLISLSGLAPLLSSCAGAAKPKVSAAALSNLPFPPLMPTNEDRLALAEGFTYDLITRWNDPINPKENFGTNNDYLAFFPLNTEGTDGILWVNHEYIYPLFVSGRERGKTLPAQEDRKAVLKEMDSVGGSLIRIRQGGDGKWQLVKDDEFNRRLTAQTAIPFANGVTVKGKREALGTMAGCAGGVTPWGTVLSAEENYGIFWGETVHMVDGKTVHRDSQLGWEKHFPRAPEHYGWIVEVQPLTGKAKKHTSLGRFAHECATIRPLKDGRVAVYTGDDGEDRCLYKFISKKPNSLDEGTLYVVNIEAGKWIPLVLSEQPVLHARFKTQLDVMIRCREAALLVGGTQLARPEDIETDPVTGAVYATLTNSKSRGNFFGSILKIEEKDENGEALGFKSSTFLPGGEPSGVSCPDNLAFDHQGNLWVTTDMAGREMNKGQYAPFKNNSLFFIPMSGENAGQAFRVASAPVEAEFTGPFFSPDGKTLFLSIQHPGEDSPNLQNLTSHWPDGGDAIPRSSVVAISGPALERIAAGPRVTPLFKVPVLKAGS